MSEQNDYATFKKHVISGLDRLDRIENLFVKGMPDTNICIQGYESWIEIKSPIEPKRTSTDLFGSNHSISQDQMNWHKRQYDSGGLSWFLIVTNLRWMLVTGYYGDVLNKLTVGEILLITTWQANKPVREDKWIELRKQLAFIP